MNNLILEIFIEGRWQQLGKVVIANTTKGPFSRGSYQSNIDYFFDHQDQEDSVGNYSASVIIPLDPTNKNFDHWPPFLMDMIPQGAARINVCKREKIQDIPTNDFPILKNGAINPIGNIRIQNEQVLFTSNHPGFKKEDIIETNELFLEHAQTYGAIVAGTSGAQGVAPKFLVNIDNKGQWHCDGALPDKEIKRCLMVKMPRGHSDRDKLILKTEESYLKVAKDLGIKSISDIWWEEDLLFLERFDRKCGENFIRYGMESLSSASGQYQFGQPQNHERSLEIINKYSTNSDDLFEFVARDFLNIVMGNNDNHTRNTAFLKTSANQIELSPLYDFAPMAMDPEMIPRSCKWKEEIGHIPNFSFIFNELCKYKNNQEVKKFFTRWFGKLDKLPQLWNRYAIDKEVIKIATRVHSPFMAKLAQFLEQL